MGRIRGFMLKHRVATIFRRLFRRRRSPAGYRRLRSDRAEPWSKLFSWTGRLKTKAKAILRMNMGPGPGYIQVEQDPGPAYIRVGQEPCFEGSGRAPEGYMAVYVGQKDGDFQRVMIPVVYINHPLFGNLLKEYSEKEFGFNHPGGLTIPCRISEFENVQTRIRAGQYSRKSLSKKKTGRSL